VIDFVRRWSERSELSAGRIIRCLRVAPSKFYNWQERYGRVNEHNAWIPRDFWLQPREKRAILDFQAQFPLEG
jgi:putative transposase